MMKWLATFLIFFLLQDLRASAEGLTVYPTSLVLDEARRVGVLTLVNRGGEEAIYELAGYRWTEADGADHLIPDKAFIVTPPVVTLAPGEQRVVRIGVLPGGAPLAVEQAYRVRVSELQSGDVFRGNALDVRLQILLPVFLGGDSRDLDLGFSAAENQDGQLCLEGLNSGDSHARLVWVAPAGHPDEKTPIHKYMLAKSSARFCVDPVAKPGGKVSVGATSIYQSDVQSFLTDIAVP